MRRTSGPPPFLVLLLCCVLALSWGCGGERAPAAEDSSAAALRAADTTAAAPTAEPSEVRRLTSGRRAALSTAPCPAALPLKLPGSPTAVDKLLAAKLDSLRAYSCTGDPVSPTPPAPAALEVVAVIAANEAAGYVVGQSLQLTLRSLPAGYSTARACQWSSSAPSVLSIAFVGTQSEPRMTALSPGTATIRVVCGSASGERSYAVRAGSVEPGPAPVAALSLSMLDPRDYPALVRSGYDAARGTVAGRDSAVRAQRARELAADSAAFARDTLASAADSALMDARLRGEVRSDTTLAPGAREAIVARWEAARRVAARMRATGLAAIVEREIRRDSLVQRSAMLADRQRIAQRWGTARPSTTVEEESLARGAKP